ncbi:MAG: helix-turn-helix transcriptional regulator [Candidatus Ornithomonoglobus sp.]
MYWLDRLKELKSASRETYKSIAEKTGIPQTTIEKLFSGRTKDPKMNMINDIVRCLGFSLDELIENKEPGKNLTEAEREIIDEYRELDTGGREHVRRTLLHEFNRVKIAKQNASRRWYSAIYYDFPVSAGTGEFLDSQTVSIAELEYEPPHGTSFILRIAGDSMEPEFHSGDHVYVESTESVEYGEIGIFVYAGSVYMKEYTPEGLLSLNPAYKLIRGNEGIKCLGRVLGIVDGEIRTR